MSKLLTATAGVAVLLAAPMLTGLAVITATGAALACTTTPQLLTSPTTPSTPTAPRATGAAPSPLPASSGTRTAAAAPTATPDPATPGESTAPVPVTLACLQEPAPGQVQAPPGAPAGLAAAITRALSYVGLTTGYAHHCDRLACRAYNYANSGYPSATVHWQTVLATGHAHPGDRCPPVGTFVYWATRGPDGHVAFVARTDPGCDPGRILLVSNDYGDHATGNTGGVYLVSLAQIESGFVTTTGYRGWSDPVCAGTLLPADTRHPLPS
jgi:hypothetical protein